MLQLRYNESKNVGNVLHEFYQQNIENILTKASRGWLYSLTYDNFYLDGSSYRKQLKIGRRTSEVCLDQKPIKLDISSSAEPKLLKQIQVEKNLCLKFSMLKRLVKLNCSDVVWDSFVELKDCNIPVVQDTVFKPNGLNILIIGAGVVGLFLANTLKSTFGSKVNILVTENRIIKKHLRKNFNRDWLTHIKSIDVQRFIDPNIRGLMADFGRPGFIGIPLNLLETLLTLSCKDMGVKFYFCDKVSYGTLINEHVACIFDATGGRRNFAISNQNDNECFSVKIPNRILDFTAAGVTQYQRSLSFRHECFDLKLKQ